MTPPRPLRRTVSLLCLACLGAGASAAPVAADEAAALYDPTTVSVVELTLPQSSIDALEAEPDEYQPGTFSLAYTDDAPDGIGSFSAPLPVKVRLKGKASFQPLTGKAAFKFKFGKSERFLGLKKMTLNNMLEDPSMLHETLTYGAFRAAAVPASRTGFVYLQVNGEDFGLYLDLETLDDVSLSRIFGSFDDEAQHLYEGEDGHDVKPGEAGEFEVDEGDEADVADLEALIAAVNSEGAAPWSERVAAVADLAAMTKMWAVEKYVGHWDGYSGKAGAHQPNNYYLFSDTTGRFQMLPWGADETWSFDHPVSFDGAGGVMFNLCLEDAICASAYRRSLEEVRSAMAALDPDALAAGTAALLAPWQQLESEESSRQAHDLEDIAEGVAATREFIARRGGELEQWLHPSAPAPAADSSVQPPVEPPALPLGLPVRRLRARLAHGAIETHIAVTEPGTVTQLAWARRRGRRLIACRVTHQLVDPAPVVLRCALTAAAKAAAVPLRLTLRTRFFSASRRQELRRRVLLPARP
jgi:CotH kinase protein